MKHIKKNFVLYLCIILVIIFFIIILIKPSLNKIEACNYEVKPDLNISETANILLKDNEDKNILFKEIIPENMQNNYKQGISKEEFLIVLISLIELLESNITQIENYNLNDSYINKAILLKIIDKNSDFNKDEILTRQEASKIIYNTISISDKFKNIIDSEIFKNFNKILSEKNIPHIFIDGDNIKLHNEINLSYRNNIIKKKSNNCFDADGIYTREDAYFALLKIYQIGENGYSNSIKNYDDLYIKYNNPDECIAYVDNKGDIVFKKDSSKYYPYWDNIGFKEGYGFLANANSGEKNPYEYRLINQKGEFVSQDFVLRPPDQENRGDYSIRFGNILYTTCESPQIYDNKIIISYIDDNDDIIKNSIDFNGDDTILFPIKNNITKLYSYYDREGNIKINEEYDEAYLFNNEKAIVLSNNEYKLIDKNGNILIDKIHIDTTKYTIKYIYGDCFKLETEDTKQSGIYKAGQGFIIPLKKWDILKILEKGNFLSFYIQHKNSDLQKSADILTEPIIYENSSDIISEAFLYNNNGNILFEIDIKKVDFDTLRYNKISIGEIYEFNRHSNSKDMFIINEFGKEILKQGSIKNEEFNYIGNGLYIYKADNNTLKIIDKNGNLFSEIKTIEEINLLRINNGLIQAYSNGTTYYYTYFGDEIFNQR